jgi:hypothetical protein
MKKVILTAVLLLATKLSFGAYTNLTCTAYRVSQDTNENIQRFDVNQNIVRLNGVELGMSELIDGSLIFLDNNHPVKASYKSKDGKGNYKIEITYLEQVTAYTGWMFHGKGHDIEVSKVEVKASRNNKTHKFTGTCTWENTTTCGGECRDESEERDVL